MAGIFCISATEFAHYIGEGSHRVPRKVGRGFSFKVNAKFPCDSDCKVVYLMVVYLTMIYPFPFVYEIWLGVIIVVKILS